jgi:hypothetical protein
MESGNDLLEKKTGSSFRKTPIAKKMVEHLSSYIPPNPIIKYKNLNRRKIAGNLPNIP